MTEHRSSCLRRAFRWLFDADSGHGIAAPVAAPAPGVPYRSLNAPEPDGEVVDLVWARAARKSCPGCHWVPSPYDMWDCSCGHTWNTFETAARCPKCERQWFVTACIRCEESFPHAAWYVR